MSMTIRELIEDLKAMEDEVGGDAIVTVAEDVFLSVDRNISSVTADTKEKIVTILWA